MSRYELLAPAGDLNRLKTAVDFGADAVFIGGKQYSLRYRASNFTLEDIQDGATYCHDHGAQLFVTANMIFHDEDLEGFTQYLKDLERIGVDAVIVASVQAVRLVKSVAPKLEAHLSTQLSTLNSKAVNFLKRLGADRVVLGRETTLEEVDQLMKHVDVPIEVFIHGAMCTNFSGRCTLSNHMTLRDANRGGCAQSCRWRYEIYDDQKALVSDPECLFTMSSKDMRTAEILPELLATGVYSLKIEGRMKSEYYLACVVSAYRRFIDTIENGGDIENARALCNEALLKAENRESFTGFYENSEFGREGYIYGENGRLANQDFLGIIQSTDGDEVILEVRNHFKVGETLEVFGPKTNHKTFVLETLINSKDEVVDRVFRPLENVKIKVPFDVEDFDFVRRAS
ncbi:peptidase U32 family protein [Erysipelothrix larvae]|nr:U32 family peptidase [Erysipelothrix larvae]